MFSKYDVYTTVQSVYCYKDTNVLKNKLNIKDSDILKEAEEEITAIKQMQLLKEPIRGNFSKTHLIKIHKFIFEDIYSFAGRIRRESISKAETVFYPPELIDRELDKLFEKIKSNNFLNETDTQKKLDNLAYVMAELNIIHPFREGNGRTIREFVRVMAKHIGININWGNINKEDLLRASIQSVDNYKILINILKKCSH